jgi:peptidoglycan/xylan/chitin deacetylase (PgdA/CDA1 family)
VKFSFVRRACVSLAVAGLALGAEAASPESARKIAITFDDLPAVSVPAGEACDLTALKANTAKLLATLTSHSVPVTGFVNEGRICKSLGPEALPSLLNLWLDAGADLGNHTFSHVDLDLTTIDAYEADIVRGEAVTGKLLSERGRTLRYFRYPFLNTGRNQDIKTAIDSFLAKRGYTVAPVTIGSNEWMFAAIYADAKQRRDLDTMKLVTEAYIPYMAKVLSYFEHASWRLFGHEIRQVLLLHDNALNADSLDQLLAMLQSRGYRFVTLAEALEDPAYRTPDDYLGSDGFSCLLHWAEGEKMLMAPRPPEPAVIRNLYAQIATR